MQLLAARPACHVLVVAALVAACGDNTPVSREAGPVWIDADVAIELALHDVDDAWALAYALRRYPASIRGISLGHGNTNDLTHQEQVTSKLLRNVAPLEIPLYVGAASSMDRAPTAASDALAEALRREPLTILTMGRLSNVATALRQAPELASRVKELVILGGRRAAYNPAFGPDQIIFPDSNVEGDAEAMQELAALAIPITLIPTELTTQYTITAQDLARVGAQSQLGAYLAKQSEDWLQAMEVLVKVDGFYPFDLFVTVYADDEHRDLLMCRPLPLRLDFGPDESFKMREEPVLRVMVDPAFTGRSVRYCDGLRAGAKAAMLAPM